MVMKAVKPLEPPPAKGKFADIDENFLHLIIDEKDPASLYHAISVSKKIVDDIRVSSYRFEIKLHSKEDIFIPEFIKANKQLIDTFDKIDVVKATFLEKLGTGDIVISSGREKILKGLQEVINQNDETFFYFGGTGKIDNFHKDKIDFDILTLTHESLKEGDKDDDNIIAISEFAVFEIDLKTPNDKLKIEKDYIFVVLPFLTTKRKQEIRIFKKTKSSTFGLENLLLSLKLAYCSGHKVVVLSNLNNTFDFETEIAFKNLIQSSINFKEGVKIKFIHQDYIKSNKIPDAFTHLSVNKNDKIVFPASHGSEIFSFLKGGVKQENIFWFKALNEASPVLSSNFGMIDNNIFQLFEQYSKFSAKEIEFLKEYKAQVIQNDVISDYIADEIVKAYTEETQSKDVKTDVIEEEIEEEEELVKEEEIEPEEEVDDEDELGEEEITEEIEIEEIVEETTTEVEVVEVTIETNTEIEEDTEIHVFEIDNFLEDEHHDLDLDDIETGEPEDSRMTEVGEDVKSAPEKPSFLDLINESRGVSSGAER